ncbi:uncharacterized protein LOC125137363 [Phacochoerus africanus]|uniref:uncharacterized protein LOC125137363 n=1 Tax=Phacochoerus africanus TaxID=41426 RepID=UPI001FD8B299|nr:uncharacterized protein LOC125137363 [Phacochoerus africanus]
MLRPGEAGCPPAEGQDHSRAVFGPDKASDGHEPERLCPFQESLGEGHHRPGGTLADSRAGSATHVDPEIPLLESALRKCHTRAGAPRPPPDTPDTAPRILRTQWGHHPSPHRGPHTTGDAAQILVEVSDGGCGRLGAAGCGVCLGPAAPGTRRLLGVQCRPGGARRLGWAQQPRKQLTVRNVRRVTADELPPPPAKRPKPDEKYYSSSIWALTCDGLAGIVERCNVPEMRVGDWMLFENMGAYTVVAASTCNGFQRPAIYRVMSGPRGS